MRYLKIFKSKEEKEEAFQNGTLDKNSVTIYGEDIFENGVIEYGIGNDEHKLDLGYNDSEESTPSSSNDD